MHQAHQGVQRKVHLDKVPFQDMSQPQNYHQPLLKGRFIHIVGFELVEVSFDTPVVRLEAVCA